MAALVYLGDAVSAAGWRLAGATVQCPATGEEAAALDAACQQAALVLVSAAVAAGIASPVLRDALSAPQPLVLLVPDLRGQAAVPDLAARLLAQLGLEP
jgi:vacuolar-type H+-ATPase subunit F/Vma7